MTLSTDTSGTFAIAPTPFRDDGRIDVASIDRMTDFYLEVGCAGITVLGIMGEAPKLDAQEALDVARGVIKGCLELGKDPGETVAIFRIPGAWEEEGFKILDKYGIEYCDRSVSLWEAAGRAVAKIQGAA